MNYKLKITDVKSISEIPDYWTNDDYVNLLEEFNFPDAKNSAPSELRDLLEMAITDGEPHEAAEIFLKYKFKNQLSSGQIGNLSHEMADDNQAEENADLSLHYSLFNINQFLRKSYNGIFPNAKATKIDIELIFKGAENTLVTKELALKSISKGLSDKSPLLRLFEDQLNGKEPFGDAEKIIWELHNNGENRYTIVTSDYWINEEDINELEFSSSIKLFDEEDD